MRLIAVFDLDLVGRRVAQRRGARRGRQADHAVVAEQLFDMRS